jgi:hypothetical protein
VGGAKSKYSTALFSLITQYIIYIFHLIVLDKRVPKMHTCRNGTEMAELKGIKLLLSIFNGKIRFYSRLLHLPPFRFLGGRW